MCIIRKHTNGNELQPEGCYLYIPFVDMSWDIFTFMYKKHFKNFLLKFSPHFSPSTYIVSKDVNFIDVQITFFLQPSGRSCKTKILCSQVPSWCTLKRVTGLKSWITFDTKTHFTWITFHREKKISEFLFSVQWCLHLLTQATNKLWFWEEYKFLEPLPSSWMTFKARQFVLLWIQLPPG